MLMFMRRLRVPTDSTFQSLYRFKVMVDKLTILSLVNY